MIDYEVESIECNLCHSLQHDLVLDVSFLGNQMRIVRCQMCSLEFLNPRPTIRSLKSLYQKNYYEEGYLRYTEIRINEFKKRAKSIGNFMPGRRLLDVGSGVGFFLKALPDKDWEKYGIEPSEFASAYARENYGLKVITGELDENQFEQGYFDVVTMFSVIGHLPDPKGYLQKIFRILRKDGLLVLQFPNFYSPWHRFNFYYSKFFKVNRLHIPTLVYRFDRRSIRKMLEQTGYEIHKFESVNMPRLGKEYWPISIMGVLADILGSILVSRREFIVYARRK